MKREQRHDIEVAVEMLKEIVDGNRKAPVWVRDQIESALFRLHEALYIEEHDNNG